MACVSFEELIDHVGISTDKLNQKCSDQHISDISLFLTNWQSIAPHLGLTETDEEDVEQDGKKAQDRRYRALRTWKAKLSFKATYRALVDVLLKIGRADFAEKVCTLLVDKGATATVTSMATPSDSDNTRKGTEDVELTSQPHLPEQTSKLSCSLPVQSPTHNSTKMGLPPLEYSDCFLDSPNFREVIALYEKELESNADYVKSLVKECQHMIRAAEEFSKVQKAFAQCLNTFKFQTIGEQTEDEKMIINSLQTIAGTLLDIEDFRHNMLSTISVRLLQTLERFRKEQIRKAKDEKKKFDRASEQYYAALEKNLAISSKKNLILAEVDSNLEREHARFSQSAFDYVCKLQDVHTEKQYQLIEPFISYISDVSTFLHQAYDSAVSIKPEIDAVQSKVHILRETHKAEQEKSYQLKTKVIKEGREGVVHHPEFLQQGHLLVQDAKKVSLGQAWHRYFCQFRKVEGRRKLREMKLIPVGHHGLMPSTDFIEVRDCVRSKTEDVERRFCFEVELATPKESRRYTVQSTTVEGRKGWLEIMEGREPIYFTRRKELKIGRVTPLGLNFVQKCIDAIEARGLEEEGLYQKHGVLSKANKLVRDAIERGKVDQLDFSDVYEWDTKTLASAVKGYFRKQLGEPLLTFKCHQKFIDAAKIPDRSARIETFKQILEELPDVNRKLLVLLLEHLNRVVAHSDHNHMKASNLGVVFSTTLMCPEQESVASIMDIKYQNIVIEMMISEMEKVFPEAKVADQKPDGGGRSQESGGCGPPPDSSATDRQPLRLWDATLDIRGKAVRGLEILSRVMSHHGRGSQSCPLCDAAALQSSVLDHILDHHRRELFLEPELDVFPEAKVADQKPDGGGRSQESGGCGPPPDSSATDRQPLRQLPPISANPNIPPPPITQRALVPSSSSSSSRTRSKSPEPYEVPRSTHYESGTAEKRRALGPAPPVPRNKPQVSESALKRRTFVPLPKSNSRPTANKMDSHPLVAPSESNVKKPIQNTREREMDTRGRGRNRDTESSPPRSWRKVPPPQGKCARALYDCDGEDSLEISFKKDEILYNVSESEEPDWLKACKADGRRGLVPANYLEMLP